MIRNGIENVSKLKQQRIKHCRQAMVCPSIHPYPRVAPVRHLAPVQQHLEPPPINILRSPCWRLLAAQSQPGPTPSNHSFFPRTISQTGDPATSEVTVAAVAAAPSTEIMQLQAAQPTVVQCYCSLGLGLQTMVTCQAPIKQAMKCRY